MFAVIKASGFQYVVKKGERIIIPAILGTPGKEIEFDRVLMLKSEKGTEIGKPYLNGVKIKGIVKRTGRFPKAIIYKFIRRENYRRKKGHRQSFTEVEITDITKGG
ncbi:MAG: 50S ribosomal protein L21 [candidate division WOR-3 bacterium]